MLLGVSSDGLVDCTAALPPPRDSFPDPNAPATSAAPSSAPGKPPGASGAPGAPGAPGGGNPFQGSLGARPTNIPDAPGATKSFAGFAGGKPTGLSSAVFAIGGKPTSTPKGNGRPNGRPS
jgi:hypothetical protein